MTRLEALAEKVIRDLIHDPEYLDIVEFGELFDYNENEAAEIADLIRSARLTVS